MGIERATAEISLRHSLLGRSMTRQTPLATLLLLLLVGCTSLGRVDGPLSQSAGTSSARCPSGDGAMRPEENKRIVRRLHDEVWTRGKLETADEMIAPDFVGHFPGGAWNGVEEFKRRVSRIRTAFPDWSETEEDSLAEGDKVVSRWVSRGTHLGEFMGIAATGKRVTVTEMAIFRFCGGKIVERWSEVDRLGMMQQIGAIPVRGEPRR